MNSHAALLCLTLAACGHTADTVPQEAGIVADAGDAVAPGDGALVDAAPGETGVPTRVRIMAANLTSGAQQSYELPGIHIFQGLAPDIVLIQEFNYAGGDRRGLVDTAFGAGFAFFVEPRASGIPNGIVSRYPIVESGVWVDGSVSDRSFVYARIDVPGPIDLWAVSIHFLTTGASQRAAEATQLLGYIDGKVPPGDYLVVGGDFNTAVANEQSLGILAPRAADPSPFPADQNGNANTSINRNHPHDWVLASANLEAHKTPVTIGAASFAAGLVFDSRVYTPLADVAPVVLGDSAATGMQHMPVVRDYMIGGPS